MNTFLQLEIHLTHLMTMMIFKLYLLTYNIFSILLLFISNFIQNIAFFLCENVMCKIYKIVYALMPMTTVKMTG